MLRKREEGVDLGALQVAVDKESYFARGWPALMDFLFQSVWQEDGSPRALGSLLVFSQDGYVKVRLVDNAQDLVAFWSGQSITEVLEGVNHDLETGRGDWRAQKPFQGKRKP